MHKIPSQGSSVLTWGEEQAGVQGPRVFLGTQNVSVRKTYFHKNLKKGRQPPKKVKSQ